MSLLNPPHPKFGDIVEIDGMLGHRLVVGWVDGNKTYTVCEGPDGLVVYANIANVRVARLARSWKDRPREQRTSR